MAQRESKSAADPGHALTYPGEGWPKGLPQVWLMYVRPGERASGWLDRTRTGGYIAWRHGSDAHTLAMRPGDTALLYLSDGQGAGQLVGVGIVCAVRRPFLVDRDQMVQRLPIRLLDDWRDAPLDWSVIRDATGAPPTRGEGAVHPVPAEAVEVLRDLLSRRGNDAPAFPVPYSEAWDRAEPAALWDYLKGMESLTVHPDYVPSRRLKSIDPASLQTVDDLAGFESILKDAWLDGDDEALESEGIGFSAHASSDLWTVNDRLGYGGYARAIYQFLSDRHTQPPLTVSIQAPWGGGKTSLMRMIQVQIDPDGYRMAYGGSTRSLADSLQATTADLLRELTALSSRKPGSIALNLEQGHCASIWFNAWRYQSANQVWAGLATAIIRGITDRLKPVERERFLLRLHLSRVSPRRVRLRVYDAVAQRFADLVRRFGFWVVGTILAVCGGASVGFEGATSTGVWLLGAAFTLVAAGLAYLRAHWQTRKEPAKLVLSDYVDVPDYDAELGFVHHVSEDLHRVFELLPEDWSDGGKGRRPLLIFIDDLDRCAPQKVAEVFEAINLFIAGEFANCYIVIAMDSEVVDAALEEAHEKVVQRLPPHARRSPLGWRFMDKCVQLPFVIPPLTKSGVADYAEGLATAVDLKPHTIHEQTADSEGVTVRGNSPAAPGSAERLVAPGLEALKRERRVDAQAAEFRQQVGEKVRALLKSAVEEFQTNPRELKRLTNVYRFYSLLLMARRAAGDPVPTDEQLQAWLRLSLAWPEVARWLHGSHHGQSPADREHSTAGHRLARLEEIATAAGATRESWSAALCSEFSLASEVPWIADQRLFRFFQKVGNGQHRLSKGAGTGFW